MRGTHVLVGLGEGVGSHDGGNWCGTKETGYQAGGKRDESSWGKLVAESSGGFAICTNACERLLFCGTATLGDMRPNPANLEARLVALAASDDAHARSKIPGAVHAVASDLSIQR
jgi:hypothetical protein